MYYADNSHQIRELLDMANKALLFTRPGRFGKSAALSMLRAYFGRSAEDLTPLFQDLSIWGAGQRYRAHFQRYPVIHLSFKEIKAATWQACEAMIRAEGVRAASEHTYLVDSQADDVLRSTVLNLPNGAGAGEGVPGVRAGGGDAG